MIHLPYHLVLGSKSPRRQQLLTDLGLPFTVRTIEVDETFPPELKAQEIPLYLAGLKAKAYTPTLGANELLITADTVVWVDQRVLNKPSDREEAMEMLLSLVGKTHEVFTAVGLTTINSHH
jgi:septum formation protein